MNPTHETWLSAKAESHAGGTATTPFRDQTLAGGKDTAQADLWSYAERLATNARDSRTAVALEAASSDPDAEEARAALDECIASGFAFTTDELPHSAGRGVLGALILQASKAGRIRSIGRERSKRIQAHGRWIEVWVGVRP